MPVPYGRCRPSLGPPPNHRRLPQQPRSPSGRASSDPRPIKPQARQALDRIGAADVATAPAPGVEEIDPDSNAVTDQVEAIRFIFGDPRVEGPPATQSNSEPHPVDWPMPPALEADAAATPTRRCAP